MRETGLRLRYLAGVPHRQPRAHPPDRQAFTRPPRTDPQRQPTGPAPTRQSDSFAGVSWLSRFSQPRERVTGAPTSSNGASSFHLWWDVPGGLSKRSAQCWRSPAPLPSQALLLGAAGLFRRPGRDLGQGTPDCNGTRERRPAPSIGAATTPGAASSTVRGRTPPSTALIPAISRGLPGVPTASGYGPRAQAPGVRRSPTWLPGKPP